MTDTRSEEQRDTLFRRHLMRGGNLVNEPVTVTATTFNVVFTMGEQDANYGVTVAPSWLTTYRVYDKTISGYSIEFGTAAPADATIDTTTFRKD